MMENGYLKIAKHVGKHEKVQNLMAMVNKESLAWGYHVLPRRYHGPGFCVLRFTANQGRFYSNFSSENFAVESSL